jgi:methyltransferase (TIGR00027 family)
MQKPQIPDHTAVRVALWRAMHVLVDAPPHVLVDEIGLKLATPDENWRQRPDMHPEGTRGYRASIVGRARVIEDLVQEQLQKGVGQYVILGAGLDTFTQRRPELASRLRVFEIDMPATQEWKRKRLMELGFGIPKNLHLVPVDFEAGESWHEKLVQNGFSSNQPAVLTSTGVSMYLTKEANMATLREIASLAKGSTFAMTFMLPLDLIPEPERAGHEFVYERAKAAGTPFISFFRPSEILEMAREAGFSEVRHVSGNDIKKKYFADRPDGLEPSTGEEFLIATV